MNHGRNALRPYPIHSEERMRRNPTAPVVAFAISIVSTWSLTQAAEPNPGPKPSGMKVYVTGNTAWVTTAHEQGYAFLGGGSEPDGAMAWMTQKTHHGDFVVIRTDSSNGYNDYVYTDIGGVDSVHTLVIGKKSFANTTYVETIIRNAEALFIAGGNQKTYYDLWNDTKVESAIHYLIDTKKAVVGGTSAGMVVLGDLDYIPQSLSVTSTEALANPYHANMNSLRDTFLWGIPLTTGLVNDTHFSERDRLGRTIAFMARSIKDGVFTVSEARAIACDEGAAVCMEANGAARLFGWDAYSDYIYFFRADTTPDRCVSGQTLNWVNATTVYKVRGLSNGVNSFNLSTWTGSGGSWQSVNVNNGMIDNDIQEPD